VKEAGFLQEERHNTGRRKCDLAGEEEVQSRKRKGQCAWETSDKRGERKSGNKSSKEEVSR